MTELPLRQTGSQVGRLGQEAEALDTNRNVEKYLVQSVTLTGPTYQLLDNASATGSPTDPPMVGGSYIWTVVGTFGGATVKLQALGPDNSTYIDITGASLTSAGSMVVQVGAGAVVKAVVTGGSPSGLYSSLT